MKIDAKLLEEYNKLEKISVDYAIMEKADLEAIAEVINSQEYITTFDPHRQIFILHTKIKEA